MLVNAEAEMGFLEPFFWNLVLASFTFFKYNGCTYIGMWGLFWYNDGGEMMDACFKIGLNGALATFEKAAA